MIQWALRNKLVIPPQKYQNLVADVEWMIKIGQISPSTGRSCRFSDDGSGKSQPINRKGSATTSPSRRLFATGYSLFVTQRLVRGVTADKLKARIKEIPLATSVGGQFRETLEAAAAKAKWPLHIAVSCSSFTQAARAVHAGECGAVLPDVAPGDFDEARVVRLALPFLRGQARPIALAWNPRLVEVRRFLQSALDAIEANTRG